MTDQITAEAAAGVTRPRLSRSLRLPAWTGLSPFFLVTFAGLLLPIGFLLWQSLRVTTYGASQRDPVTEQFIRESHTSFTLDNFHHSLQGINLTAIETSLKLSAITAILAAILGLVLAQAVVSSKGGWLKQVVTTASAVTANFGGIPLAFLFIATLDANAGTLTTFLQNHFGFSLSDDLHFDLHGLSGIAVVYMYFLIPLMVLVIMPALEGIKAQWGEAAENLGASRLQYWRWVAGPVLLPSFLGCLLLVFCAAFSAYATAHALNSQFPLVTNQIASLSGGDGGIPGQENVPAALAIDMILVVLPLTAIYLFLQRRTSRWFG